MVSKPDLPPEEEHSAIKCTSLLFSQKCKERCKAGKDYYFYFDYYSLHMMPLNVREMEGL